MCFPFIPKRKRRNRSGGRALRGLGISSPRQSLEETLVSSLTVLSSNERYGFNNNDSLEMNSDSSSTLMPPPRLADRRILDQARFRTSVAVPSGIQLGSVNRNDADRHHQTERGAGGGSPSRQQGQTQYHHHHEHHHHHDHHHHQEQARTGTHSRGLSPGEHYQPPENAQQEENGVNDVERVRTGSIRSNSNGNDLPRFHYQQANHGSQVAQLVLSNDGDGEENDAVDSPGLTGRISGQARPRSSSPVKSSGIKGSRGPGHHDNTSQTTIRLVQPTYQHELLPTTPGGLAAASSSAGMDGRGRSEHTASWAGFAPPLEAREEPVSPAHPTTPASHDSANWMISSQDDDSRDDSYPPRTRSPATGRVAQIQKSHSAPVTPFPSLGSHTTTTTTTDYGSTGTPTKTSSYYYPPDAAAARYESYQALDVIDQESIKSRLSAERDRVMERLAPRRGPSPFPCLSGAEGATSPHATPNHHSHADGRARTRTPSVGGSSVSAFSFSNTPPGMSTAPHTPTGRASAAGRYGAGTASPLGAGSVRRGNSDNGSGGGGGGNGGSSGGGNISGILDRACPKYRPKDKDKSQGGPRDGGN
ncbi:uncharacterized protein B0I36DRAFT_354599 [Microdochium trichocladiopsis]|uniref:Uncharacterized protein n=1 Tax=Microdochium trichocladiopsis TaxID=1682393 RepID=A0A9P8XUE1_9PEZI|nr:uncharacterized protein B0I36DRAFT_354599 [Microdochium trichocladiopsis]KAH7018307.1 hypothetical protein B0I36DRAFT_354599 [Microdochium trichocladiopsis]